MSRNIRIVRTFSIIVFLGVLLYVYAYLPEQVGIDADATDEFSTFVGKEVFFYFAIASFMLTNVIFIVFGKLMQMIPVRSDGFFVSADFKERIHNWFSSFGLIINLFFISVVAFVGFFNNADYYHISSFSIFAYIGQVLIFIWIVLFFYLLSKRS
ncbi:MAG: hypothetical protein RIC80_05270 [Cyclobacteriaceae bacterium]